MKKKKKSEGIPITGHEDPLGDVDTSVHMYPATALGRGRIVALRSAGFTPGKAPLHIVQEAEWTRGPVWT